MWLLCALLLSALPACRRAETGEASRRKWSFPVGDAKTVVVQCWQAREVRVVIRGGAKVEISAQPRLQPTTQHGPEPDWRTTRAEEWSFAWEERRDGARLVLRSRGETHWPHWRYVLDEVVIAVPPGVKVLGEKTALEHR